MVIFIIDIWLYLMNIKKDKSIISHQADNTPHSGVLASQIQPIFILHLFQYNNTRRQMPMIHPLKHTRQGTSLVAQWLRLCNPNTGDLGLIPSQRTRSHMPQLIVYMWQFKKNKTDPACCKTSSVTTKTQYSQTKKIN